jgi:tRNA modification GTPase
MYLNDTIVAPATPAGAGAVAIVRMSGPRAMEILDAIWRPVHQGRRAPRKLYLGDVIDPGTGTLIDRALAVVMPNPASLTGEDVVELQCHGGALVVRRIVSLAMASGARMAEPGEFTRRAFLNGRMDLAEAEAVADIIAARSEAALSQALSQLSGALSERVAHLRRQVIGIRAHLEVEIDFSDEDIGLPSRRAVAAEIELLIHDVAILHDSFARGRRVREGVRATIVGKPNAGKSSILNLMLGADRAIVTAIAGTTRDVIEDSVQLGPYALVLSDTAGVRESLDEVERIGIERTLKSARDADLLIAVFDSSRPFEAEDAEVIALTGEHQARGGATLAILNKQDLPHRISAGELRERGVTIPILALSAIDSGQAATLRAELERMIDALLESPAQEGIAISRERHREALAMALGALKNARDAMLAAVPPEIVAVDVMSAADALGSITGEVGIEDVLDAIFREFCIGK